MQRTKQKFLAWRVLRFRDAAAYQALYREYVVPLERHLSLKLPRREDVDEAVSEVFLRGWEYMTASPVEYPQAFFFRIASNLVASFYRDRKEVSVLTDAAANALPSSTALAAETESNEAYAAILEKISQLPDRYQLVIRLHFIEERSIPEIALELGTNSGNVRIILFRAKRAFQKL